MGPTDKTQHFDRKQTRSQQSLTVALALLFGALVCTPRATIVATPFANPLAIGMATCVAVLSGAMRWRSEPVRAA